MEKRLPSLLVNSYSTANFTFTLLLFLPTFYYAIFLTDVALITAIHVSAIMLITHIADAISIPVSGAIIQKTQMRWGRFRSWLTFIPVVTFIFFTLTFTNLPLSYGLKMVFLSAMYIIGNASLNCSYSAHMGLISVLTNDPADRLRLSSRNMQFGMASQVMFSIAVVPMLLFFSRGSETMGFIYTTLVISAVQVLGYWNLFYQTRGYEKYEPNKVLASSNKLSVPEMVGIVFKNKHLLILMFADTGVYLGVFTLQTLAAYYFKYITQNEAYMSPYSLSLGIATFVSTILGQMTAKKAGKKNTYLFAAIWGIAGYFVLRLYGDSSPVVYIAIACLTILGAGLCYPLRQAMFMDAAEYSYYKTGKDASAFIMSMLTFPMKIGVTLAGTLATSGLAFIGYEAGMEITKEFTDNLMNIICYIPIGCGVITFACMLFYSLTDDKVEKYMAANKLQRAEAGDGV